jgi:tetratricopeptide (TPR) repeat protein
MSQQRSRFILVSICVGVAVFVWLAASRHTPEATSSRAAPFSDAPAIHVPLDTERGIRQFETRVREDPRDFISLTVLGQLYARKGREKGDLDSFRRAEEAANSALARSPDHAPAVALRASVYLSQHRFGEALRVARDLYDRSPSNIEALATMADAHFELGQYTEAEKAVRTLTDKAGGDPAVLARRASIAQVKGRTAEAVTLLQQAAGAMRRTADPGQEIAWFEARLADLYFHSGCVDESERHFDAALQLFERYPVALTGLADVRVAQGRFQDAADLYERAVSESPQPRRLFALAAVEETLGRVDEAQRHYQQGEESARTAGVVQPAYYRDLAVFYADRLGRSAEAVAFAQQDLEIRKDVKAYDVLAWALFRNGRFDEAARAIGEAMKLGTRDPDFYYHAGMIYDALGDAEKGRTYLDQALQMSPRGLRSSTQPTRTAQPAKACVLN